MSASTRKRPIKDSLFVCFYCTEYFRSLTGLIDHQCPLEGRDILNEEPFNTFSDIGSFDFDSIDSEELLDENQSDVSTLQINEAESTESSVTETSSAGVETEYEKPSSETKLDEVRQESAEQTSDILEKLLIQPNSDGGKEDPNLISDSPKKQLIESNSIELNEEIDKLASKASKKPFAETDSSIEQKITEAGSNANDGINRASLNIVSEVLQCYEAKQSSESFSEESNTLNCNPKESKSPVSNMCSNPSPSKMKTISPAMLSRSSIETGLDCRECDDDQADSDKHDILSSIKKKPDDQKHDHVHAELSTSEIRIKSLLKEDPSITEQYLKIVKPCYVEVQDIFKSLSNTKISPEKIFQWKKKYHVCNVCNKFYRLKSDLNIHCLVHTTVKPHVCNICEKSFTKRCNLITHHLTHVLKKKYACSVCKRTFLEQSLLLRHERIHTKEKPFSCNQCGKSFLLKSSLTEHYLTHSNEKPYICEICSAAFGNKRYLRRHYYSHQKNKNNVCEFCYKTFKRKNHLEEHYNIHTNERPYECKFCNKSYHFLLNLNNHYSMVHRCARTVIPSESVKTFADSTIGKSPVIQKIENSDIIDNNKKAPLVQKIEIAPVACTSKEIASCSTRRKSFIPRRYMQPD